MTDQGIENPNHGTQASIMHVYKNPATKAYSMPVDQTTLKIPQATQVRKMKEIYVQPSTLIRHMQTTLTFGPKNKQK